MNKLVPFVLLVVCIFTRYSVVSTPVNQNTQGDGDDKRSLRGDDEAMEDADDERAKVLIKPKSVGVSLRNPNVLGVRRGVATIPNNSHFTGNAAFMRKVEKLGINMDTVRVYAKKLKTQPGFDSFEEDSLVLMVLGREFFQRLKSPEDNIKWGVKTSKLRSIVTSKYNFFRAWKARIELSGVEPERVFGKLYWLINNERFTVRKNELAEMAWGSELLKSKNIEFASLP